MTKGIKGFQKGHPQFTKYRFTKGHTPWNKGKIFYQIMGKNHPRWKGGKMITKKGYIEILKPNHPFAKKNGYVLEHRLVMEKYLGRYLNKNEIVHHIDGIKSNNKIKNLVLCQTNTEHKKLHSRAY